MLASYWLYEKMVRIGKCSAVLILQSPSCDCKSKTYACSPSKAACRRQPKLPSSRLQKQLQAAEIISNPKVLLEFHWLNQLPFDQSDERIGGEKGGRERERASSARLKDNFKPRPVNDKPSPFFKGTFKIFFNF